MLVNKKWLGITLFLLSLVIVFLSFKTNIWQANRKNISFYYDILQKQEYINSGTQITDSDMAELNNCKKLGTPASYNAAKLCIRDFYEKFTLKNGVNKAFSHISLLEKQHPNFIPDCHYVAHGIGHAQLQLDNGNIAHSLAFMSSESYFKNMSTCGNGYFHGAIEQYSKDEKTKGGLVKILKPVCEKFIDQNIAVGNCYHGVGHAAYVQMNNNLQDSLWVCDNITDKPNNRFYCYSGLFMEATGDLPLNQKIIVTNGKFDLVFCNALENKYKPACYFQMSSLIEKFTKNSNDHANNIKYCKQITDPVLRLACVEVVASVAVSQFHYNKVPQMCRDNTTNRVERILCTGIFASKIARGIDSSRNSELFTNTVDDICGTLSYFEASKCKELVKKNSLYLYLVNENSLAI